VVYDGVWNSSDYAHHLSRRARGLPLWFSLATHGTHAYAEAVEQTLLVAREAATRISNHPHLELVVDQSLSICVFRRIGWEPSDYKQWSDDQLERGESFVTPTKHKGETVLRFCIVNPRTTVAHIEEILATL
jgi:glutamate/tyrosine decarboxylase-like PLP-dependent enzyme